MLHRAATKIVNFFNQRNLIEKDNEDWCVYFVETRIISYVVLLLLFVLLLPIARPIAIIVFLLSVLLIRRRSGGYHCKTEQGCFFISLFVAALGIFLARFLEGEYTIQLLLLIFSACSTAIGPVNQPELHLSPEEYRENTRRLRVMTVLLVCIAVIMIVIRTSFSSYCVMGLLVAGISIIAGKFSQNGRNSRCL